MVIFFQTVRIVKGHVLHVVIYKKIFSARFVDDWKNGPHQASRTSAENNEVIFNVVNKIEVENAKVTSQKGEKYLHEPIMNGEELEHDDQNGRRNWDWTQWTESLKENYEAWWRRRILCIFTSGSNICKGSTGKSANYEILNHEVKDGFHDRYFPVQILVDDHQKK